MKYKNCRFCQGSGCIACPGEAKKDNHKPAKAVPEVLLSVDPENPEDMDLLASVFHRKKIEAAFEKDGGGIETLKREAAIARLKQVFRKAAAKGK